MRLLIEIISHTLKMSFLYFSPAPGTCVDCDGLRSRASALLSELEAARRDGERAREEAEEARGKAEKEVRYTLVQA